VPTAKEKPEKAQKYSDELTDEEFTRQLEESSVKRRDHYGRFVSRPH
jgi:hypothetical protein